MGEKGESELKIIVKAKELSVYTFRITSNCNHYPKKYRFSIVDKMQNKVLSIYESLFEANRTDLKLYKKERLLLQSNVINYCDELLFYIELSTELGIISINSIEYWVKMISDIKFMTLAWRKGDKDR